MSEPIDNNNTNLSPIIDKSVWYGEDIINQEDLWSFDLNDNDIEILSVIGDNIVHQSNATIKSEGYIDLSIIEYIKSNPPIELNEFIEKINKYNTFIHNDLGFFVLKKLPVHEWSKEKLGAIFLLICMLMGNLCQQNALGHVLGHVKDLGLSSTDPRVRIYQTNERQTFHTDSCDIVGLLCLQIAKQGGLSSIVSSGTIFNEMLKIDKDLVEELLKPIPTDRRGEIPIGCLPYYMIPVFNQYKGTLTTIYQRQYIDSLQRFHESPRLSDKQIKALNVFDSLADNSKLNLTFQLFPGDMLFCNNHVLLHDRTAFIDHVGNDDNETKTRHLYRIWIATLQARELPLIFSERFGSVTIGNRGGVNIPGVKSIATLNASKIL